MIKIITAVSSNGVIGVNNSIPWNYKDDMQHFKKLTLNSNIIMGRNTFESIGSKPLPKRRNIIITSKKIENIECYNSIESALENINNEENIWFIGGSRIYEEGMKYSSEIHLTITPDIINNNNAVSFPFINPLYWKLDSLTNLTPENVKLFYAVYIKC